MTLVTVLMSCSIVLDTFVRQIYKNLRARRKEQLFLGTDPTAALGRRIVLSCA